MKNSNFKKGDTLIEVMFAVSAFAIIVVGSLTLMNAGMAKSQASLQLTMARNAIDSQAEALRYINSVYLANYPNNSGLSQIWNSFVKGNARPNRPTSIDFCPRRPGFDTEANWFFVDPRSMSIVHGYNVASTYPRIYYGRNNVDSNNINSSNSAEPAISEGVWIEAIKGDKYYDFHIRACWDSPGSSTPSTIGTIVRLYDPAA